MAFSCPHCTKDIEGAVSKTSFDERVQKLTEQRKDFEARAVKAEALASQAAPLAARVAGYDADPDTLEVLGSRYERAAKAGYTGGLAEWLQDDAGAAADTVAARFRSAAPAASPAPAAAPSAAPAPVAAPAAAPAARLPTTATSAPAPAPLPAPTAEQVHAQNRELMGQRRAAVMRGDEAAKKAIDEQIAANRGRVGAPVTT